MNEHPENAWAMRENLKYIDGKADRRKTMDCDAIMARRWGKNRTEAIIRAGRGKICYRLFRKKTIGTPPPA
ncbi:MAG: hypothetical protein LBF61_11385 [Azoarcus sp.]|nr:hypothetical protein [Azoarcus sp.]